MGPGIDRRGVAVALHLLCGNGLLGGCGSSAKQPPAPTQQPEVAHVEFTKYTRDAASSVFRELKARSADGKDLWSLTFDSVGSMAMCPDGLAICAEVEFEGQTRVIRVDAAGVTQWTRVVGDAGMRGVLKYREELGVVDHVECATGHLLRFAAGNGAPSGDLKLAYADAGDDLASEGIRQCGLTPYGAMAATWRGHVALFGMDGQRRASWRAGDPSLPADQSVPDLLLHALPGRKEMILATGGTFLSVYDIAQEKELARFDVGFATSDVEPASTSEVYVVGSGGDVRRVTLDGTKRWQARLPIVEPRAAVGKDGTLAVGDRNGYLFGISPEGKTLWGFVDSKNNSMAREDLAKFAVAAPPPWAVALPPDYGAQPEQSGEWSSGPRVGDAILLPVSPTEAWSVGYRLDEENVPARAPEMVHFQDGTWKAVPWIPDRKQLGYPIEHSPETALVGGDGAPWLVGQRVSRKLIGRGGPESDALKSNLGIGSWEIWSLRDGTWRSETENLPASIGSGPWDTPSEGRVVLCAKGVCAERVGATWVEATIPEFARATTTHLMVWSAGDETWLASGGIVWRRKADRFEVVSDSPPNIVALWGPGGDDGVWAVSGQRLWRFQHGKWTWEPAPLPNVDQLSGSSSRDVWAHAGYAIAHFDGERWRRVVGGPDAYLLKSAGPGAVWATTESGIARGTLSVKK